MNVRKVVVSASAACALAMALALVGCGSGQHEVIDQGQDCSSCHSGSKQVYEDGTPSSAVEFERLRVGSNLCQQVLVCKPIFVTQDGSKFVPEQVSSVKVVDGSAQVQLSEGTWALCATGKDVKAQLVTVSPEASGPAATGNCSAMGAGNGHQLVESVSMQTSWLRAGAASYAARGSRLHSVGVQPSQ